MLLKWWPESCFDKSAVNNISECWPPPLKSVTSLVKQIIQLKNPWNEIINSYNTISIWLMCFFFNELKKMIRAITLRRWWLDTRNAPVRTGSVTAEQKEKWLSMRVLFCSNDYQIKLFSLGLLPAGPPSVREHQISLGVNKTLPALVTKKLSTLQTVLYFPLSVVFSINLTATCNVHRSCCRTEMACEIQTICVVRQSGESHG